MIRIVCSRGMAIKQPHKLSRSSSAIRDSKTESIYSRGRCTVERAYEGDPVSIARRNGSCSVEIGKDSGRYIPIDWDRSRGIEKGGGWRGSEGGSSCQRQRRSGMAPILVLILVVCNRGGGNVVLSPTGSHRHRELLLYLHVRTTMYAYSDPVLSCQAPRTANLVRLTQNQLRNCPIV